jgi:hypothetical protein
VAAFETFRRPRRLADECTVLDSDDLTRHVAGDIGAQRGDGRLSTHRLCNIIKSFFPGVSHKRIHMHDNARAGGDREYRSALSLPLVDDLSERGGQQRRPDDNVGCSATKATFRR